MDRLDDLEAQSIFIFREAYARLKHVALLWSLGKDSNVMIWIARKAFFGRVPFPALHVDTGKKFPEMYAFRDRYASEWNLDLKVEQCPPVDAVDPSLPPAARSAARKTEGLKLALAKYGFDGFVDYQWRTAEALALFERCDIPCSPMHDLDSLIEDPHLAAVGFFHTAAHPTEGQIRYTGIPSRWNGDALKITRHAPQLGEHSVAVLGEAGLSAQEIAALIDSGATLDGGIEAAAPGPIAPKTAIS